MDEKPSFNPCIALVLGICAVSTGALFARLAEAPSLVIAAYRLGLAAILILPLSIWMGRGELCRLSVADWRRTLLSGGFLALHFAAWISSLAYTSVVSSVVLVDTSPLWVAMLSPLFTGERPSRMTLAGIGVSVIGASVIGLGDLSFGPSALLGDLLALVGAVMLALYLLMGRCVRSRLSLLSYVGICYGSGAAVLWAIVLVLGLPVTGFASSTWGMFLAMAVVPQLMGHSSYNWALRWLSTPLVSVSLLGEPVCSILLAWIFLGETVSPSMWIGGALTLGGIYMASRGEGR